MALILIIENDNQIRGMLRRTLEPAWCDRWQGIASYHKARPDLKVIVFSGYSIEGPARKILDAGAQDFIQKPFSIPTLSEKLKEVLGDWSRKRCCTGTFSLAEGLRG